MSKSIQFFTDLVLKVIQVLNHSHYRFCTSPQPATVSTPTLASKLARDYERLSQDAKLIKYKVTCTQVFRDENKNIEKVEIGPKCLDPSVPTKVLMILGQTGAGKSTLINAIVNYIFGIKWEDSFRFLLIPESKNQTQSQTQWITAYTFHLVQGSKITFNLTIIDTPGFGDTQGLERDKKLMDQIQHLFNTPALYGIDHLDGIAFTVKASDVRLTPSQEYIFDAVMSIFGKDIKTNIFIMATHSDGGKPSVCDALCIKDIPTDKTYTLKCTAFLNDDCDDQSFWKKGVSNIESFFTELQKVESKSLTLTKKVLKNRKHLEVCVEGLQKYIMEDMSKLNCLKQERRFLRENSINHCKAYKVVVDKQRLVDLAPGEYVTNCLTCNRTCHYPCEINRDEGKHGCAAMKPQDNPTKAICMVCPGKCSWQMHKNGQKRIEHYTVEEEHTLEDLEKRYGVPVHGKGAKEEIIKLITTELHHLEDIVLYSIRQAYICILNLEEMALKPKVLSPVQYIELLIQAEKSDP